MLSDSDGALPLGPRKCLGALRTHILQPGIRNSERTVMRVARYSTQIRPNRFELIVGHMPVYWPRHHLKQSTVNGRVVAIVSDGFRMRIGDLPFSRFTETRAFEASCLPLCCHRHKLSLIRNLETRA